MRRLALMLLAASTTAGAHAVGVSRGEYEAKGTVLTATLIFARGELAAALPASIDSAGRMTPESLDGARPELEKLISAGLRASAAARPCLVSLMAASLTEGDGVQIRAQARCEQSGTMEVELPLLNALPASHRHFARWTGASGGTAVLFRGTERFAVDSAAPAGLPLGRGSWASLALLLAVGLVVVPPLRHLRPVGFSLRPQWAVQSVPQTPRPASKMRQAPRHSA